MSNSLCLLLYVSLMTFMIVNAAPLIELTLDKRIVYNPPVTDPKKGSVWVVNEQVTVTWDTSVLPEKEDLNVAEGKLILGYILDGDTSEHLDLDDPLAEHFSLWDGEVDIKVPDVPMRESYIVVLMGNSGNASPEFTIEGGEPAEPDTSTTTKIPVSSTRTQTEDGQTTSTTKVTDTNPDPASSTTSPSTTTTSTSLLSLSAASESLSTGFTSSSSTSSPAEATSTASNAATVDHPVMRTVCLTVLFSWLVISI